MRLFTFLALISLISPIAHSAPKVLLSLEIKPLGNTLGGGGKKSGVALNASGKVMYFESSVLQPSKNEYREVTELTRKDVSDIKKKIAAVKSAPMKHNVEFCEAIPSQTVQYTANQGQLVLLTGARPCGGSMERDSEEARDLVRLLDEWFIEANH
jgi:hypothetical protein